MRRRINGSYISRESAKLNNLNAHPFTETVSPYLNPQLQVRIPHTNNSIETQHLQIFMFKHIFHS